MAELPDFPPPLYDKIVKQVINLKPNTFERDEMFEEVSPEKMVDQSKDTPIFLYVWHLGADVKNDYKLVNAKREGDVIKIELKTPFYPKRVFEFRDDKKDKERPYVKFYRLVDAKDYLQRLQTLQQSVPDQYLPPELKTAIVETITGPKKKAGTRRRKNKRRTVRRKRFT